MSRKAIVFYCKECGELFFAAIREEKVIKNNQKEIIQYLSEGHKMKEIDIDKEKIKLGSCICHLLKEKQ